MRAGFVVTVASAVVMAACGAESGKDTPARESGDTSSAVVAPGAPAAVDSAPSGGDLATSSPPGGSGEARATVLFVGTSLTAGLGLDPDDAYPALLQRKADSAGYSVRIVNAGLSGETSAGALRRVDWLLRGDADVIVIETGANDGLRGLDVDSTTANIRAILRKVKAARPDAQLLLAQMEAPPNLGVSYTARFRGMFPALAQEFGATLIPFLLEEVAAVSRLNQPDGIHPNEEGSRIVAGNVWRALQPVLASLDRTAESR